MKIIKVERYLELEANMILSLKSLNKVSQYTLLYSIIHTFKSLDYQLYKYNGYDSYSCKSGEYNQYEDLQRGYITIYKHKLNDLPKRLKNKTFYNATMLELYELFENGDLIIEFENGSVAELFDEFIYDDDKCIFKFNNKIIPLIKNQLNERYCQICLGIIKNFKSINAVRLFEMISLSKNINGKIVKTCDYVATIMEKENVSMGQLNRALSGVIDDINKNIDIGLSFEYDRYAKEYIFKYDTWKYKKTNKNEEL